MTGKFFMSKEDNNSYLEEYKMLREEVLHFMNKDTTLLTCLFSSVTAILFFAVEWKVEEGCILCFLVIIPIASKLAYHQKQMAKISAYLQIYLEPKLNMKWESFLFVLGNHGNRPKTARYLKFSECILMGIASVLVFLYLTVYKITYKNELMLFIMELALLLFLFIWTILISKKIYSIKKYRREYVKIFNSRKFSREMEEYLSESSKYSKSSGL